MPSASQLDERDVFDRLEPMLFQNVTRDEIGKRAESRHTDRFAFQLGEARNRRGREKRRLPLIILTAHHDQIRAGKIGINNGAGRGVNDFDIAAEQRLNSRCAGADKQQVHIGAVFQIQTGLFADPENRKSPGESGVGDAEFLRVGVVGFCDQ
jgi:hypothetical protein